MFHDIRLALTLNEKIVFMKQGEVATQGDPQALASKEFLQTIFETDIISYLQKQHKVWETIQ